MELISHVRLNIWVSFQNSLNCRFIPWSRVLIRSPMVSTVRAFPKYSNLLCLRASSQSLDRLFFRLQTVSSKMSWLAILKTISRIFLKILGLSQGLIAFLELINLHRLRSIVICRTSWSPVIGLVSGRLSLPVEFVFK